MTDRPRRGKIARVLGADHDRCRWRLPVPAEGAGIRQHDVHPRRLDALHGLDGPRNLALERAHPRDLLHERSEPDRAHVVEKLVSGVGAAGQPLLRQHHPRLGGLPATYEDLGAVRIHIEVNARLAERRADATDILRVESAVKRFELRPAHPIADQPDRAEHGEADEGQYGEATLTQRQQIFAQLFDLFSPDHSNHPCSVDSLGPRSLGGKLASGW